LIKCDIDFDFMYGAQSIVEFVGAEESIKYDQLDYFLVCDNLCMVNNREDNLSEYNNL
jgi:hypothetical protein